VKKQFAFTLDLEATVSGVLDREYGIFGDPEKIENLLSYLRSEGVKISVFVVGEIFERYPQIIRIFEKFDSEFHCHSYSHDPQFPDSRDQIERAKSAFVKYFKNSPIGYRAPQGKISSEGIDTLEEYGFKFDSSIMPSYYPNPFKYLFKPSHPHFYKNRSLLEIPSTTISPLRLNFSISYVKLLGYLPYRLLLRLFPPSGVVVFGSHLHDFFLSDQEFKKLPFFWKVVYRRNRRRGIVLLKSIIRDFKKRGYTFVTMADILKQKWEERNGEFSD
jgi:hypothetical protein